MFDLEIFTCCACGKPRMRGKPVYNDLIANEDCSMYGYAYIECLDKKYEFEIVEEIEEKLKCVK